MGSRDANRRRGMGRAALAKVKRRVEDPALVTRSYSTETCEESSETRIVFYSGPKQDGEILAVLVLEREETYEFGNNILHCYDTIEGIANERTSD